MQSGYFPCPHPAKRNTFPVWLLLGGVFVWFCAVHIENLSHSLFKIAASDDAILRVYSAKQAGFFTFSDRLLEKDGKSRAFMPLTFAPSEFTLTVAMAKAFRISQPVPSKMVVQAFTFICPRAPPAAA